MDAFWRIQERADRVALGRAADALERPVWCRWQHSCSASEVRMGFATPRGDQTVRSRPPAAGQTSEPRVLQTRTAADGRQQGGPRAACRRSGEVGRARVMRRSARYPDQASPPEAICSHWRRNSSSASLAKALSSRWHNRLICPSVSPGADPTRYSHVRCSSTALILRPSLAITARTSASDR